MILSQIITRSLASRKRLVVPQLGAFLVKVPGREVLFSEMMKRDDGVLRSLLRDEEGMSEIEASGAIDRFVFEVRHAVESDVVYRAEGLGIFAAGPNGTIQFRFLPETDFRPAESVAAPAAEPLRSSVPEPAVGKKAEKTAGKPENAAGTASRRAELAPEPETGKMHGNPGTAEAEPSGRAEGVPAEETRRRIKELMKHDGEHPSEGRSSSSLRRPDPSVRGLRYGKPLKTTDAYTFVGSAPSRRFDTFIFLAVAAVLLAVGAILYGYLKERRIERQEQQYIERIASQGIDPAGAGEEEIDPAASAETFGDR